ncbi:MULTISPECIES: ribosome assembly cofactor RimP [unclassified Algibacter]|uniref:ribosome assembly cofactor RimP n=1 Tax=unclassified Algibacter TaxID=2615009 RepID=UPI00131DD7A8|nr:MULTISPECIES: ribosome assembly cofactor RimP [unclassified Algibacter]MCL5126793.1 ribosome assembly cofactor RimP [Algibacter sp. L4_22]
MFKTTVENLLEEALTERQDLFLISLTISAESHINIVIDGDNGVLVEDCIFISRFVENDLDREEHDYSIEVMSAGATASFTHQRQYIKNIDRTLNVRTKTEEVEGVLTAATENDILLEWKTREPKPVGKGKVTVKKQANIAYDDIVEAKVVIKF